LPAKNHSRISQEPLSSQSRTIQVPVSKHSRTMRSLDQLEATEENLKTRMFQSRATGSIMTG